MKIKNNKTKKPGIRLKVYVREDMVGGGKLELLRIVGETGSISSAAKKMGLDYKRAWFLLDTLQRCFNRSYSTTDAYRSFFWRMIGAAGILNIKYSIWCTK